MVITLYFNFWNYINRLDADPMTKLFVRGLASFYPRKSDILPSELHSWSPCAAYMIGMIINMIILI
jgi:hypothetical protein